MKNIIFLLLLVANTLLAQSIDDDFYSANDFYKNEKFDKAIELYHQIESKGTISVELYYNLGNSYYKINKVGPAIYYFEKALKLDPTYEDAQNNLIFAKRLGIGQHSRNSEKYFSKDQCKLFTAAFLQSMGDSFGSFFIFSVYFIFTILFCKFSHN